MQNAKKFIFWHKSNRKAMKTNWSNQKANPALKTKAGNKSEGDLICDKIVPGNQKVLFIRLTITFPKRSVTWLYKCKIAVIQLISNIAQSAFKKGY